MDMYLSGRKRKPKSPILIFSVLLNIVLLAIIFCPDDNSNVGLGDKDERGNIAAVGNIDEPNDYDHGLSADIKSETSKGGVVMATADASNPTAENLAKDVDSAGNVQVDGDVQVTIASLQGSIPQTLARVVDELSDNVSATLSRVLFWDLDLRRDLRAGDKLEVMWVPGTSDGVVIKASRFQSQKYNRTFTAYRFKATGDTYPSYWSADGTEVPYRLKNEPLEQYEQVTSLLKDRPTHQGMDFKVDVGTPIKSPFNGVVTRMNWNHTYNGNGIEIRHQDGVLAKYLHLSENHVKVGDRVRAGQVIGLSGNTGRSTGPHLHYQLNQGSKVVDPIDYHGTVRRTLPQADRAAFTQLVDAANTRLETANLQ